MEQTYDNPKPTTSHGDLDPAAEFATPSPESAGDPGPWGDSYKKDLPAFAGDQGTEQPAGQPAESAEPNPAGPEFGPNALPIPESLRDFPRADGPYFTELPQDIFANLKTPDGQRSCLEAICYNSATIATTRLDEIQNALTHYQNGDVPGRDDSEGDVFFHNLSRYTGGKIHDLTTLVYYGNPDEAIINTEVELDRARLATKLLGELELQDGENYLEALSRKTAEYVASTTAATDDWEPLAASANALDWLRGSLASTMEFKGETPEGYVSPSSVIKLLGDKVTESREALRATQTDYSFDEQGRPIANTDGEKFDSNLSPDARADLEYAENDLKVMEELTDLYQTDHADYYIPAVIPSSELAATAQRYCQDHADEIARLNARIRLVAEGSPAYHELAAARKRLARERSAALRLAKTYLGTDLK